MPGLTALAITLGAAVGASPILAEDLLELKGAGLAPGGSIATPPARRSQTKLTMGLDTLSAEYQAYRQAVANGTAKAGTFATENTMATVIGDAVVIDAVAADAPQDLKAALEALGAEVTAVAGRIVSARLPLDKVPELEDVRALQFARPAVARNNTGAIASPNDKEAGAKPVGPR